MDEHLEYGVQRIVESFESWLRECMSSDNDKESNRTGVQFKLLEDKHQVVFEYRRNSDKDGWWLKDD